MGDGNKSISFFGLVAMGIGCMLGTSWLLLTGPWLEVAGGPLNLAVAFALCIVVELPFAFAYMEAIPMPVSYTHLEDCRHHSAGPAPEASPFPLRSISDRPVP